MEAVLTPLIVGALMLYAHEARRAGLLERAAPCTRRSRRRARRSPPPGRAVCACATWRGRERDPGAPDQALPAGAGGRRRRSTSGASGCGRGFTSWSTRRCRSPRWRSGRGSRHRATSSGTCVGPWACARGSCGSCTDRGPGRRGRTRYCAARESGWASARRVGARRLWGSGRRLARCGGGWSRRRRPSGHAFRVRLRSGGGAPGRGSRRWGHRGAGPRARLARARRAGTVSCACRKCKLVAVTRARPSPTWGRWPRCWPWGRRPWRRPTRPRRSLQVVRATAWAAGLDHPRYRERAAPVQRPALPGARGGPVLDEALRAPVIVRRAGPPLAGSAGGAGGGHDRRREPPRRRPHGGGPGARPARRPGSAIRSTARRR